MVNPLDLIISTAQAADGAAPQGSMWPTLIMLAAFILFFYFFLWRPQSKRAKDHRELVASMQKGDEVVMTGGLMGRVTDVRDDMLVVEVASGVELKFQKGAVSAVLPKGTLKSS